jgi:methyl-accepting chemotaxis protein
MATLSHTPLARFNDLTISKKLALSFGTLLVGLAVGVAVAVSGMGSMKTRNTQMRAQEAIQVAAQATRGAGSDMHYSEAAYVAAGPSAHSNYLADRQTFQTTLDQLAALSGSAADKRMLASIKAALATFDEGEAKLWALVKAGRTKAAVALMAGAQNDASDALMSAFDTYTKHAAAQVEAGTKSFESAASSATTLMIVVGVLAALLGLTAAFVTTRSLAMRARQMRAAADGIAEGDVEQHIEVTSRDELGATAAAFQRMVEYLRAMVGAAGLIADGDLSAEVQPRSERDALGNSFAKMIASLRNVVGNVSGAAGRVTTASQQMASTSDEAGRATGEIAQGISEVAQGAERQVVLVEEASRAAQEMAEVVRQSAEQAEQTATVASQARDTAQQGVVAAERASDAMSSVRDSSEGVTQTIRELAAKSEQIGNIVATITGIAEQTNLLALNAAIEAARAGEQGRGFAVVAEEVRKLAEDSQSAAHEIGELITAIQGETARAVHVVEDGARKTSDGADVVQEARDAFESIGAAVDDMAGRVTQIAAAAQQISDSASHMQQTIGEVASVAEESSATAEQVSASTEQTSASTQQIAASAGELATSAEQLNVLVSQFKLNL